MKIDDTKVVRQFEAEISKYANAKYGVSVSSNSNGIFLSLMLLKHKGILRDGDTIEIPKQTFVSVPMMIKNCRLNVKFRNEKWSGAYPLVHVESGENIIWDSATRFTEDMYQEPLYVLSFQAKKILKIERGGMILTNNTEYYTLLKKMRINGRTECLTQVDDKYSILGYNCYMTPSQASFGLTMFSLLPEKNKDIAGYQDYPDLSQQEIFK